MIRKYNQTLASYFTSKPLYLDESNQKKPNIRKLVEQPWQQLLIARVVGSDNPQSQYWDIVADFLININFLEAKLEADLHISYDHFRHEENLANQWSIPPMLADLLQDFYNAKTLIPFKHPKAEVLQKFYSFFSRHLIQFTRSPLSLSSQLSIDFNDQSVFLKKNTLARDKHKGHIVISRINSCESHRTVINKIDLPFRSNIVSIERISESDEVLIFSQAGEIVRVDARQRIVKSSTRIETAYLYSACLGNENRIYCLSANKFNLTILDAFTFVQKGTYNITISEPRWISYSHSAELIVVGGSESVEIIEPSEQSRRVIAYPTREKVPVPYGTNMMEFNNTGSLLAIACQSGDVLIFDMNIEIFWNTKGYCGQGALSLTFESESILWVGSLEGKLLRWNFETGEKQLLSANDDAVESLLWLSEEKMLVSGHRSGMLRFWNNFLKKPIFEIAPTNRWIRTLKELRFLNLIMLGTDSILTMPAVLDEIRNLNFGEVDNIASEIIPQAKEIILTANDSILRYPFSNIGLAGAVPIGALSSKIINDRTNVDSNDEMHFSGDNPWEKSEKVYTTAICTARNGKLTFIGCSNGSIFGFDFVLQKIVFASISKGEPITSICCNEVGSELVYVACRSIFGITIDIQARLVHSARVRIGYEFKKFPLLRFIGEQHILCDTVKCTHYSEKTEFVEWNESTELEIRDLPDLNKICNIQLPINLVYSVYSSHLNSIFAIEGDIRFASKSYSNISGEHDFKVGRFAPIKMRRYAVWRIRLSGSDENLSFTGVFEKLCTGHISPPLGISISDNNKFISVLSRDGNLSLWNSLNGKRMQEIQLKSNGLVGPVFTKSHELVCADNGQGNKTGPEIYQLIIH